MSLSTTQAADSNHGSATPAATRRLVLGVSIALALGLCAFILLPFVPPLAWALALAVMAGPVHRWLRAKLGYPSLAAGVAVALAAAVIVAPVFFVSQHLVSELSATVQAVQKQGDTETILSKAGERHTWLRPAVQWVQAQMQSGEQLQQSAGALTKRVSSLLSASIWAVMKLFIALFALFFFLRDKRQTLTTIHALTPLSLEEVEHLAKRVADTVHATVYGTMLVAAVQGALGGLMFWWLGLPAPLLWGIVMGFLAVVPVLGAFVVWVPAAIWLAIDGNPGKALLLTAWGVVVIGLVDNLLYPMFVGARLHFHTLVMFIAVVGGLMVFGASGIILGPVILALADTLMEIWRTPAPKPDPEPQKEELTPAAG